MSVFVCKFLRISAVCKASVFQLNSLSTKNIINSYPPLYDLKNSLISQHEHTISIKEKGIEILT